MTDITSFSGKYDFLSNFFPVQIDVELVNGAIATVPTVEHGFQMAKTLSIREQLLVLMAHSPGVAKRLGKNVVTLRPDWDAVKVNVMRGLLIEKFKHPVLRKWLHATGNARLVEGNSWGDYFWGSVETKEGLWLGENHLGKLLMEIRNGTRR